jgi:hypothetical protein
MGIQIWMRDAPALLREARNSKQNDFAGSIARPNARFVCRDSR